MLVFHLLWNSFGFLDNFTRRLHSPECIGSVKAGRKQMLHPLFRLAFGEKSSCCECGLAVKHIICSWVHCEVTARQQGSGH